MNLSPLAISYFLHLVATVVWLGGMGLLVLLLYPLQQRDSRWDDALLDSLEARFRPVANFSLLVLLVTGVVQTSEDAHYGGLLNFDSPWSRAILAKHVVMLGMVLIVGFLQFGLEPALERLRLLHQKNPQGPALAQLRARRRRLMRVNFGLGMLVLLFTASATAI